MKCAFPALTTLWLSKLIIDEDHNLIGNEGCAAIASNAFVLETLWLSYNKFDAHGI